jgi:hypothetical protein
MSIIRKEQLSNPLSASYASTASYAENAGVSINTGSFVTTSSFNTYTASINNFTSSINTFTASYNTGSFTGSFTGSLFGTATTASYTPNALVTASVTLNTITFTKGNGSTFPIIIDTGSGNSPFPYTGSARITGSLNVIGVTTITGSLIVSNSIDSGNRYLYDANSSSSVDWNGRVLRDSAQTSSLDWEDRKLYDHSGSVVTDYSNPIITQHFVYSNNTHTSAKLEDFSSTFNYAGVILYEVPINASLYELVSLSGGTWSTTQHWKNTATVKLGIVVIDNGNGTGDVLLEGDIVVNGDDNSEGPYVTGVTTTGEPIYIADSFIAGNGQMSETAPDNEYLRTLGHLYYNNVNTNSSLYIMRFNPSNDYYRLV